MVYLQPTQPNLALLKLSPPLGADQRNHPGRAKSWLCGSHRRLFWFGLSYLLLEVFLCDLGSTVSQALLMTTNYYTYYLEPQLIFNKEKEN